MVYENNIVSYSKMARWNNDLIRYLFLVGAYLSETNRIKEKIRECKNQLEEFDCDPIKYLDNLIKFSNKNNNDLSREYELKINDDFCCPFENEYKLDFSEIDNNDLLELKQIIKNTREGNFGGLTTEKVDHIAEKTAGKILNSIKTKDPMYK